MHVSYQILSFKLPLLMAVFIFLSPPVIAQEEKDTTPVEQPTIIIDTAKVIDSTRDMGFLKDTSIIDDTAQQFYYRINGTYLKTYAYDLKHVVTAPFHWKGKDWVKFAAITGTTGLLMIRLDKPVREMMLRNQNGAFKEASKIFYPLGNRFPPALLAGMYVTSLVTKNRRLEHATLSATKSLAIATIIYTSSKSIIRRQRPTRTDDPLNFVAPFTKKGYTSFPSGHANTAFSVATAFAMEYKDVKWVPWVAYTLATLTSVSRLYDDRHWISDVVIGASIGHFVTKAVYRLDEKRKRSGKANLKTW